MNSNNEGLTVGELSMAIAGLIIIFLIWSGISKKNDSKVSFYALTDYHLDQQR
tara:strand:+ start:19371 stop:19529 length:159 start_codon:yes stop_codon:yes gene_type:complete